MHVVDRARSGVHLAGTNAALFQFYDVGYVVPAQRDTAASAYYLRHISIQLLPLALRGD